MELTSIHTRIQHKHDLEKNWNAAADFIPLAGEIIIYDKEVTESGDIDISKLPDRDYAYAYDRMKIGDGSSLLSDLPFIADGNANSIDVAAAAQDEKYHLIMTETTIDRRQRIIGAPALSYSEKEASATVAIGSDTQVGAIDLQNSSFSVTLSADNLTASRTLTLPDATGTLAIHADATIEASGLLSAADKAKLNSIDENANCYVLPPASAEQLGGVKLQFDPATGALRIYTE